MKKKNRSKLACITDPVLLPELTRRELLRSTSLLTAYTSTSMLFPQFSQAQSYPVQRRLVWINMGGGWDVLEITDPKVASTSGIDMTYDWGLAHSISSSSDGRLGRWLSRLATQHGNQIVALRGITMATTAHNVGQLYMDTGVLSNSGNVNAASIPAIVASESSATIPIIQLGGGSDPLTDRGLLNPVSPVRAQNLELYRSMYPAAGNELTQKLLMLDHLNSSISAAQTTRGVNDRLSDLSSAASKVRTQFEGQVGEQLALVDEDLTPFQTSEIPRLNQGRQESFALALKMLRNNLVSCVNLGFGGFDTHANQEASMQPNVEEFDFLLSSFVTQLQMLGQLDNTLIVVYSDFGRTPKVNARNGRDHWPFGGALMIGGGIDGGRFVGATDDDLRGLNINASTGLVDSSGISLKPGHLGGSVLELTLGSSYLQYRTYLESIASLTRLRSS